MRERGEEIERFFHLLLRLCALVFGYLMILGGGLFALAFAVEQLRTGAIAINGELHRDVMTRIYLQAIPLASVVAGFVLARVARRTKKQQN